MDQLRMTSTTAWFKGLAAPTAVTREGLLWCGFDRRRGAADQNAEERDRVRLVSRRA
jgi:hypothetical protein